MSTLTRKRIEELHLERLYALKEILQLRSSNIALDEARMGNDASMLAQQRKINAIDLKLNQERIDRRMERMKGEIE